MVQEMTQLRDIIERLLGPGMRFDDNEVSGPVAEVDRDGHRGRISLFGGQVLEWQPAGHDSVLWLSDGAVFDQRAPIRGGIPVCWPWFADGGFAGHETHGDWPLHGFARTNVWSAESVDDAGQCTLVLPVAADQSKYWPHASRPCIVYGIGATLSIAFEMTNIDPYPIEFTQALHTYFSVGDIEQISISGLEASPYIDKLTGDECPAAGAPIAIDAETDRIYQHLTRPIELHDPVLKRTITIEHDGAANAIVWNPWLEKSARLDDMGGADAYRGMVCIETGNVSLNRVRLQPGETYRLVTNISVQKGI